MTPIVLIHGGGFDSRCWDLLMPHLGDAALAVDLPGRGRHPASLHEVSFEACADAVAADVDAAGHDEVIVVGHSLAGCSMPKIIERLEGRVRHAVFIGCTVPEDGRSAFDTLDPEVQRLVIETGPDPEPAPMSGDTARIVLGNDLEEDQVAWCVERLVPEAPRLVNEPVTLAPLRDLPSTWLRTTKDLIVPPEKQLRFARNVGDCTVVDLDAGHMAMVSKPTEVAARLQQVRSSF